MTESLLLFDTSTHACTVALSVGDQVWERHQITPSAHNEHLIPSIKTLLKKAKLTINQLSAIAFGQGPGHFVGVRLAASVAQGLGFAADKPIIPISTLHILAQGAFLNTGSIRLQVAWDARLHQVYFGDYAYDLNTHLTQPLQKDSLYTPDEVLHIVGKKKATDLKVGNAWALYPDLFQQQLGPDRSAVSVYDDYPHASAMVELAKQAYRKKCFLSAEQIKPVYLRKGVADKPSRDA